MKNPSRELSPMEAKILDQTWQQLEREFHTAPMVAPRAGFADRWEGRWAAARHRQQRVRNNWMVAAHGSAILLFLTVVCALAWSLVTRPAVFTAIVNTVIVVLVFALTMLQVTVSMLAEIPLTIWLVAASISVGSLVMWADLFRNTQLQQE